MRSKQEIKEKLWQMSSYKKQAMKKGLESYRAYLKCEKVLKWVLDDGK